MSIIFYPFFTNFFGVEPFFNILNKEDYHV
jgi:hypothetical protein